MYCGNCGAAQSDRASFCTRCGGALTDAGQDRPAPAGPRPPAAPGYGPTVVPPPPAAPGHGPTAVPPPEASGYRPQGEPPPDIVYAHPPQHMSQAYPQQLQPPGPPFPGSEPTSPASPPRRRRGRALVAAAAAVVVLGGLAVAGWQEHWPAAVFGRAALPALTWSAAAAPLPADASKGSSLNASLNDVACADARSCVAVGYYTAGNASFGLVETLSHGTWTAAKAPTGGDLGQTSFVYLGGVSCPAEGACVAVGSYYDSQNVERPLIETLSGGTWSPAKGALPGDADQGKSAFLSQAACPARDTCEATGWYTDQNGDSQGVIDTLSDGSWTAQRAPLPAGAIPRKMSSSTLPTGLFVLKCPAVGTCVATGDYSDRNGSQGLIDTLSGGTWATATAPLPGDAAAPDPVGLVWAIACPAAGNCMATGHYNNRNGQSRGLIETLSGGTWTPATAPLPADAAARQKWSLSQVTGLTAVACREAGTCLAAGSYAVRNGTIEGEIDTLSGGTWTAARARLPADAATAKQNAFFVSATCQAVSDCVAVGGYKTQGGGNQALIDTGTSVGSK